MKTVARLLTALAIVAALLLLGYVRLDDSKKRFVQQLGRQVPYLVPRYFA